MAPAILPLWSKHRRHYLSFLPRLLVNVLTAFFFLARRSISQQLTMSILGWNTNQEANI